MAHATRGLAATFIASTLALAACGGNDNVRGGGPAENQGNLTEEAYGPQNGPMDLPPEKNGAQPQDDAATARSNVSNSH